MSAHRTRAVVALTVSLACSSEGSRQTFPPPVLRPEPEPPAVVGRAVLTRSAHNPMAIALTPTADVYVIERTGEVRFLSARTGRVTEALRLDVDTSQENGLLGLALAPDFALSGGVYLYYSELPGEPPPSGTPAGRNVLARFTARPDGTLDSASRSEILSVPSERLCCHEAGSLAFAPDGTLFLSTGDNTTPWESSGTAPIDGRPGRELYDARRTSGNPFDLRGKILRLEPDGSIPAGNLFPPDGSSGRPEIFAMGVRNPFRIAVDPLTGRLFFGDVGPDADVEQPSGPRGYDEINTATAPGDFGWPECIAQNLPYLERDFASETLGAPFDCTSRIPAVLAYDYGTETYPALGTAYKPDGSFVGRSAVAGAVYRAPANAAFALPGEFQGALLMADWTRDLLAVVRLDDTATLAGVEPLFADEVFHRPIDIEVAPDGALYVLEYGSEFWGDNSDAQLSRFEYASKPSPAAHLTASVTSGPAPLEVTFSGADSRAFGAGETIVDYAWDFDADGSADTNGLEVTRVFAEAGDYSVSLVVTSSSGVASFPIAESISVGNAPPVVRILAPEPDQVVLSGVPLALIGEATDFEDGTAACEELVWNVSLGHNEHAHPTETLSGCATEFTPDPGDHAGSSTGEHLFYAIELVYTDRGGSLGNGPLTGRAGLTVELAR